MNLVLINCGLNQTYSIGEPVFQKIIAQTINDIKFIKLDGEPRISFAKNQSNVSFVIDIKIKKNKNLEKVIEEFKEKLEERFVSLVDIKPESIRFCFTGFY